MLKDNEINYFKEITAIIIFANTDYKCLELALASHARFSVNSGVHIYILQDGRGTFDRERTYRVAQRYHTLFPEKIDVIDAISPDSPYLAIKELINSEKFAKYKYIIKLDEDVLVLTEDWIDRLCKSYIENEQGKDDLAYVSCLINNNPYGFKKIIEYSEELSEEYFSKIARNHLVGASKEDTYGPYRILPKDQVYSGKCGTIWGNPYIVRWLHEKTSLMPEAFISFAETLCKEEPNNKESFSINCILFKKELWNDIENGKNGSDPEHLLHLYCIQTDKRIVADLSVPMVHMYFSSQREECIDMIDQFIDVYTDFLKLPFSIQMCGNRQIEIEDRLRYLESILQNGHLKTQDELFIKKNADEVLHNWSFFKIWGFILWLPRKIIRTLRCCSDHGISHTLKEIRKVLSHKK